MTSSQTPTRILATLLVCAGWFVPARAADDGFALARENARERASRPYEPQKDRVPAFLLAPAFTYDQHRDIRFKPSEALWSRLGGAYQVQFFHPGFVFNRTVRIHERVGAEEHEIPFLRELFDYGRNEVSGVIPRDMGFAGFRLHHQLNRPEYFDELAVFLGASYFRGLAKGQVYGLSARAIAVDTAMPSGEEFPAWEEFWLDRPTGTAEVRLHGVFDGPSVAGAVSFTIRPGAETVMHVRSTVFPRRRIESLGIAPLTSMFFYGENSESRRGDFRPEIHDSDGLQMETGTGEWVWRPLRNPATLEVSGFQDAQPRGFGLMQRDRAFSSYEDLEADYHRRPSAWVSPRGNWGEGEVRLVEIPTADETNDNMVAMWVPRTPLEPGSELALEYDLTWLTDTGPKPPGARVVATRYSSVLFNHPERRKFVIDWEGGELARLPIDAKVEPVVTIGSGAQLRHAFAQRNPYNGTWRSVFAFEPEPGATVVEMRCFLKVGDQVLSETWTYPWRP